MIFNGMPSMLSLKSYSSFGKLPSSKSLKEEKQKVLVIILGTYENAQFEQFCLQIYDESLYLPKCGLAQIILCDSYEEFASLEKSDHLDYYILSSEKTIQSMEDRQNSKAKWVVYDCSQGGSNRKILDMVNVVYYTKDLQSLRNRLQRRRFICMSSLLKEKYKRNYEKQNSKGNLSIGQIETQMQGQKNSIQQNNTLNQQQQNSSSSSHQSTQINSNTQPQSNKYKGVKQNLNDLKDRQQKYFFEEHTNYKDPSKRVQSFQNHLERDPFQKINLENKSNLLSSIHAQNKNKNKKVTNQNKVEIRKPILKKTGQNLQNHYSQIPIRLRLSSSISQKDSNRLPQNVTVTYKKKTPHKIYLSNVQATQQSPSPTLKIFNQSIDQYFPQTISSSNPKYANCNQDSPHQRTQSFMRKIEDSHQKTEYSKRANFSYQDKSEISKSQNQETFLKNKNDKFLKNVEFTQRKNQIYSHPNRYFKKSEQNSKDKLEFISTEKTTDDYGLQKIFTKNIHEQKIHQKNKENSKPFSPLILQFKELQPSSEQKNRQKNKITNSFSNRFAISDGQKRNIFQKSIHFGDFNKINKVKLSKPNVGQNKISQGKNPQSFFSCDKKPLLREGLKFRGYELRQRNKSQFFKIKKNEQLRTIEKQRQVQISIYSGTTLPLSNQFLSRRLNKLHGLKTPSSLEKTFAKFVNSPTSNNHKRILSLKKKKMSIVYLVDHLMSTDVMMYLQSIISSNDLLYKFKDLYQLRNQLKQSDQVYDLVFVFKKQVISQSGMQSFHKINNFCYFVEIDPRIRSSKIQFNRLILQDLTFFRQGLNKILQIGSIRNQNY